MGILISCCKPSSHDVMTPDAETKRRQLVEAAEVRRKQQAARGLKNPEKVKQMQRRAEDLDRREQEMERAGGPTLKWTAN